MTPLQKRLEHFGLNSKEATVYLALLELGEGTLADLARKSRVKRTTLYDIARSLKEKGLVSVVRNGGRLRYSAEDPRMFGERLHEQQTLLSGMLPELLSLANALPHKPKVRFYEGIEGIKEVYRDTLTYPDQELLAWVTDEALTHFDPVFLNTVYLPKRIAKKIWMRALVSDVPALSEYVGRDASSLRTTRLLDKKRFPLAIEINLYGGRNVAFMSFKEQTGLIVESERIYSTLKSIFEQQWESVGE
jgi:sugar-specific transcriptional regulator TrmB